MKILVSISSQRTSRLYLILLKDYLQRMLPDAEIDYFISQHDDENINIKKSAIIESNAIKKDLDLLISLDGNLEQKMFSDLTCPRVLYYTLENGNPRNKRRFVSGFDYLITGSRFWDAEFKKSCAEGKVNLLCGCNDVFRQELQNEERIQKSKIKLYKMYPQLSGKRILSIITSGTCKKKYSERYKKLNIKGLIKSLPDDVVLMTNCLELRVATDGLTSRYVEKFIGFTYRDLLDVAVCSKWIISNMALMWDCAAEKRALIYALNDFEKYMYSNYKGYCFKAETDFSKKTKSFIMKNEEVQEVSTNKDEDDFYHKIMEIIQ